MGDMKILHYISFENILKLEFPNFPYCSSIFSSKYLSWFVIIFRFCKIIEAMEKMLSISILIFNKM